MSKKPFILSSAGLKNLVHEQNCVEYFKFIFGGHEIKLRNVYAEFISPYVSQIHQSDPTIESIIFPNHKSTTNQTTKKYIQRMSDNTFSLFEQICKGELIKIDYKECFELKIISILIKNDELYKKLDKLFEKKNDDNRLNEEVSFISFLEENYEGMEIMNISKSIEKFSKNFSSIKLGEIIDLPLNLFYSIIDNDELQVESEDNLLDVIEQFFIQNENRLNKNETKSLTKFDFYEKVKFEFLSEEKFKEFIENFDFTEMTRSLWDKFKRCFYVYKNSTSSENIQSGYIKKERTFDFNGQTNHAFDGIICELTKESGGNVNDKGYVIITSSSTNGSNNPKNAADLDVNNYFYSLDFKNSWLLYDFQERRVCPTHYSIRSRYNGGKNDRNPKNWVIEGSNDGKKWTILDSQQNSPFLNDRNVVHTFEIKNMINKNEFFRYLRIRYTGPNWYNSNQMVISALEYFGRLAE